MRDSGIQMVDGGDDLTGSANPNRKDGDDGGEWASGIDAAIGTLSLDGGGGGAAAAERHPEKRLKAVSRGEICGECGSQTASSRSHFQFSSCCWFSCRAWSLCVCVCVCVFRGVKRSVPQLERRAGMVRGG